MAFFLNRNEIYTYINPCEADNFRITDHGERRAGREFTSCYFFQGECMLTYQVNLSSYSLEDLQKLLADQIITVFEAHQELINRNMGEYLPKLCS